MEDRLVNYILRKESATIRDNRVLYGYGIKLGYELIMSILCSISIAIVMQKIPETLFFYIVFIPLRAAGGGLHLKNYFLCLFVSIGTQIMMLKFHEFIQCGGQSITIGYFIGVIGILFLAPVSHERKPISDIEKRHLKKIIKVLITVFTVVEIGLLWHHNLKFAMLMTMVINLVNVILLLGKRDSSKLQSSIMKKHSTIQHMNLR